MRAEPLTERLQILKPQRITDRMGAEQVEYVPVRTVYAERVRIAGKRSEEAGEHFPDYRTEFNIRDVHPIDENWRVQHLGGKLYTVVSIVPNRRREYVTLVCERVNE